MSLRMSMTCFLRRPKFFSSRFGCGGKPKGAHSYITTHGSIPTEHLGGALSIRRLRAVSFFKGVRSAFRLAAQAEQVAWKTPHFKK